MHHKYVTTTLVANIKHKPNQSCLFTFNTNEELRKEKDFICLNVRMVVFEFKYEFNLRDVCVYVSKSGDWVIWKRYSIVCSTHCNQGNRILLHTHSACKLYELSSADGRKRNKLLMIQCVRYGILCYRLLVTERIDTKIPNETVRVANF